MAAVQRQTSQQWGHVEEESDRREHYEKEWWKWKGLTRGDAAYLQQGGDAATSKASQGGPGTWPGFRQNIPTVEQLHSVAPPVATTFTGIPPGGERPPSPTPPWREGKKFTSRRQGPTIISVSTEELRSTVYSRARSKLPPPQKFESAQPVQTRPSAAQKQQVTPQPVKVPKMAEAPTNTPKVSEPAVPQEAPASLPAPSQAATQSHDNLSAEARADYEAAVVVGHTDLSGYANVVYDLHVDKGKLAKSVEAASKRVRSRGASASGSASATREGSPVRELGAAGEGQTQQPTAAAAAPAVPPLQAQASAAASTQKTTTSITVEQTASVTAQQSVSVLESSAQVSQDAAAGGQPSWTVRGSAQGGGGSAGGGGRRVFVGRPSDFVPDHLRPTIRAIPGQRSRYIKTYSYVAKHQLME